MKILLVEDDVTLGETLKELLEKNGFEVVWVSDGQSALDTTYYQKFDLWLFDVKVPFLDGFELLKSLRDAGYETPTIFITALTDINSLSTGFEIGADDYIKKPFDFDELLVRIKALLKKRFSNKKEYIKYKNLSYNIEKEEISLDGEKIHLPPVQMRLLKLFLKNIGKTLPKDEIIWEISEDEEVSELALRVHINKLRKLGLNIKNIRKIGYILEEES